MAFKGLEDRFIANADKIYNRFSTRDGGPDAGRNDLPHLEWKPGQATATEQTRDTYSLPVGATKRDVSRMASFLKSNNGLIFLGKQQALQSANAFAETRLINPLFVIANAVPFIHTSHTLTSTSDFAAKGNQSHKSPASMDPKIGGAGRLQRDTANSALNTVQGKGGTNSLLANLKPFQIIENIKNIFTLATGKGGSLAIDERPEFNVGGIYYSIAMWQGFQKNYGSKGAWESAKASLRVGDFKGAYQNLKQVGTSLLQESGVSTVINKFKIDGRNIPLLTVHNGSRYFITDDKNATRYLKDSVSNLGDKPELNIGWMNRRPYMLGDAPVVNRATAKKVDEVGDKIKGIRSAVSTASSIMKSPISSMSTFGLGSVDIANTMSHILGAARQQVLQDHDSAEEHLSFQTTSLQTQYDTHPGIDDLRKNIQAQIKKRLEKVATEKETSRGRFGVSTNVFAQEGVANKIDPTHRVAAGGYITDPMNTPDLERFDSVPKKGEDLIYIYIRDDVNNRIIPFRAMLTGLRESVNTETTDRRYVGRVEKSIVYVGVQREVSFSLKIYAFSAEELAGVWKKVNAVTGLCFPSKFDNGFMVPPFVKLTIGDVFRQQPGLIRSVNFDVEDGTSWETEEGSQVPHGVNMSVVFSILENKQYTAENSYDEFHVIDGVTSHE